MSHFGTNLRIFVCRFWSGSARYGFVLALFAVVTLLVTYPLPAHLGQVLAGGDIDDYLNPWVDWWTLHVLTTPGESLYYTDYLFYPDGVNLTFHSFCHVNTAVSLALQPLIGQPAAYNVTISLAYLLSAFGMYLLIEYLTGSTTAGVVSGLVFAFNPYHIFESIHPILVSTQWIPLSLLFLIRWLRERRGWQVVLAALFFLLNALTSWHLMTFLSMWLVVFVIYYLGFERRTSFKRRISGLSIFVLLASLFLLPFLWPLVHEQMMASQSYISVGVESGRPVDLWYLLLPPWVEAVKRSGYLGLVTVLLAMVGVWRGGREARSWAAGALIFLLIAVGPQPQFNGQVVEGVTLPWSEVFVPLLRHPLRFHLLVMFGLAGAAGYGWVVVRGWLREGWWRGLGTVGVCLLLILDYSHWPFPTVTPQVSPFYAQLAADPGDFAITPLPSTRQTAKYYMYYQTIHGKRIVGGHVSRPPQEAMRFMEGHDLIWSLNTTGAIDEEITDISRQFDRLAEVGVRYVVLHKDRVGADLAKQWEAFLPLIPAYEDSQIVVYHTDLEMGRDYTLTHEFMPGLGIVRAHVGQEKVLQGTFLGLEAVWGAVEPPASSLIVHIALVDQRGRVVQEDLVPLYAGWPSEQWSEDAVVIDRYRVRVDAQLLPGVYDVRLSLGGAATGEPEGEAVTLAPLEVQPLMRVYEFPPPGVEVGECFGDKLCLQGYDILEQDGSSAIVFYWQAARLMEEDYVMSIRLLNSAGEQVWQRDAAPRDWSYPTSWWDAGEVVGDTFTLDVSPGYYQLEVVVYEPQSGAVLAPSGAGHFIQSDGGGLLLNEVDIP